MSGANAEMTIAHTKKKRVLCQRCNAIDQCNCMEDDDEFSVFAEPLRAQEPSLTYLARN